MVFNEWRNGIPSAFIAIGKSWENDLCTQFSKHIKTITNQLDAHVIIVDNAQAEINVFKVNFSVQQYFTTTPKYGIHDLIIYN